MRWLVPLRVVVVVLAMVGAALGVLWWESAGVQGATEQLDSGRAVAVPPLESNSPNTPGEAGEPGEPGEPSKSGATASALGTGGVLVVHVAGAVATPGVFLLPAGSRVFQAVETAGGALPTAELAALNLAAELSDGTQIFIPTVDQAAALGANPGTAPQPGAGARGGAAGAGGTEPATPVSLNAASAEQLEALPGLGPVLAQRIVQWRTDHGAFATVDGLQAVPGIGTKLLEGLRPLVAVP